MRNMTKGTWQGVMCMAATAAVIGLSPAAQAEVIVKDSFPTQYNRAYPAGTNGGSYTNNLAPSDTNLPGGKWIKVAGWDWGDPFIPASWDGGLHDYLNMAENVTGVAISLAGYTTGILEISADIQLLSTNNTNGHVALGFYSALNTAALNTGGGQTVNFTGIDVGQDGTMRLYADGAAGTPVSIDALGDTYHTLSYRVDTATGAISNILLDGNTISGLSSTAFTSSAVAYGAFVTNGGTNGRGSMDNFTISSVVPEPATLALLAIGGLVMLRRQRSL